MHTKEKTLNSDTLYKWDAPSRPYKKRDRTFFQTAGMLAILLVLIAVFIREWLLIGAILSVVFIGYVLAAVEPPSQKQRITKKGIWVGDVFYKYSLLSEYWFEKQLENDILFVVVLEKQPRRIMMVLPPNKKNHINDLLKDKLVFREQPLKSTVDKISGWLVKKIPLEETARKKAA